MYPYTFLCFLLSSPEATSRAIRWNFPNPFENTGGHLSFSERTNFELPYLDDFDYDSDIESMSLTMPIYLPGDTKNIVNAYFDGAFNPDVLQPDDSDDLQPLTPTLRGNDTDEDEPSIDNAFFGVPEVHKIERFAPEDNGPEEPNVEDSRPGEGINQVLPEAQNVVADDYRKTELDDSLYTLYNIFDRLNIQKMDSQFFHLLKMMFNPSPSATTIPSTKSQPNNQIEPSVPEQDAKLITNAGTEMEPNKLLGAEEIAGSSVLGQADSDITDNQPKEESGPSGSEMETPEAHNDVSESLTGGDKEQAVDAKPEPIGVAVDGFPHNWEEVTLGTANSQQESGTSSHTSSAVLRKEDKTADEKGDTIISTKIDVSEFGDTTGSDPILGESTPQTPEESQTDNNDTGDSDFGMDELTRIEEIPISATDLADANEQSKVANTPDHGFKVETGNAGDFFMHMIFRPNKETEETDAAMGGMVSDVDYFNIAEKVKPSTDLSGDADYTFSTGLSGSLVTQTEKPPENLQSHVDSERESTEPHRETKSQVAELDKDDSSTLDLGLPVLSNERELHEPVPPRAHLGPYFGDNNLVTSSLDNDRGPGVRGELNSSNDFNIKSQRYGDFFTSPQLPSLTKSVPNDVKSQPTLTTSQQNNRNEGQENVWFEMTADYDGLVSHRDKVAMAFTGDVAEDSSLKPDEEVRDIAGFNGDPELTPVNVKSSTGDFVDEAIATVDGTYILSSEGVSGGLSKTEKEQDQDAALSTNYMNARPVLHTDKEAANPNPEIKPFSDKHPQIKGGGDSTSFYEGASDNTEVTKTRTKDGTSSQTPMDAVIEYIVPASVGDNQYNNNPDTENNLQDINEPIRSYDLLWPNINHVPHHEEVHQPLDDTVKPEMQTIKKNVDSEGVKSLLESESEQIVPVDRTGIRAGAIHDDLSGWLLSAAKFDDAGDPFQPDERRISPPFSDKTQDIGSWFLHRDKKLTDNNKLPELHVTLTDDNKSSSDNRNFRQNSWATMNNLWDTISETEAVNKVPAEKRGTTTPGKNSNQMQKKNPSEIHMHPIDMGEAYTDTKKKAGEGEDRLEELFNWDQKPAKNWDW